MDSFRRRERKPRRQQNGHIERVPISRRRANKSTQNLARSVNGIAFGLITDIIHDPSQAVSYVTTANTFQYFLYVAFLVMTSISLSVGLFLLLLSKWKPDTEAMISSRHTLSCAAAASVILAMGAGLCAVLPEVLTGVIVLICFIAGVLAYRMNLHVLILTIPAIRKNSSCRRENRAARHMATKVILTASPIISTMVLFPCDVVGHIPTMNHFGYYLFITFTTLTFISFVLGFLLLLLSTNEDKSDEMMFIQGKLKVAAVASTLLALAAGLGLIGLVIVYFLAFVFRRKMDLHIS